MVGAESCSRPSLGTHADLCRLIRNRADADTRAGAQSASDIMGHANDDEILSVEMFVLLAGYAVLLWICACVANGKNWARIAVTLLSLIVALAFVAVAAGLGLGSPPWEATALLDILSFGIDAYALFLIWTKPGSAWFRK